MFIHDGIRVCECGSPTIAVGAFRDAATPLRKAIVESRDNAPFESRIPFFFREFRLTLWPFVISIRAKSGEALLIVLLC
jgi:hypothetical protein